MPKKYYNKLQKENFIELKTLEYYLGDKNKAKALFELRHKLTTRGFELYIKYWLKKLGYKMTKFTGGNKADGGIDLKGEYKGFKVYVQCKKYIKNSTYKGKVNISDIRNFYGGVTILHNGNIENKKIFMLFTTTGDYTDGAKDFAKKANIKLLNYEDLAERLEKYSLEDFFKDFKGSKNNIINKNYAPNSLIDFSINDLQQEDLFNYFKNIREYIVKKDNYKENETGLILSDETIKEIINKRAFTYQGMKDFYFNCKNNYQQERLEIYWKDFIRGINLI